MALDAGAAGIRGDEHRQPRHHRAARHAWRKSIYRQVGILASKDQAAAVRQVLKDRPYLDADRVGVWGWSGGGSMTLNALFRYPDLYHAGISIAPVPNQLLYDTIYQERYMGLPDDNKEGYKNGSPITFAKNLKGKLQLIHGTADDNVHYQGMAKLVDTLVAHNKPFEMLAYPNRSHSIREGKGTTLHLRTAMTEFYGATCRRAAIVSGIREVPDRAARTIFHRILLISTGLHRDRPQPARFWNVAVCCSRLDSEWRNRLRGWLAGHFFDWAWEFVRGWKLLCIIHPATSDQSERKRSGMACSCRITPLEKNPAARILGDNAPILP